ncbi:MAG: sialidase family protein [Planctomycetota bacterium]|jgi:hypothetical protein
MKVRFHLRQVTHGSLVAMLAMVAFVNQPAHRAMAQFGGAGSFGEVALLNNGADSDTGDDANLQLATDGAGNWVAVWESDDPGDGLGNDLDILVSISQDGGATWSDPAALNSDADSDSADDTDPALVTDRGGAWIVVWNAGGSVGGSGTSTSIHYARSTDNGRSWDKQGSFTTPTQQVGSDGAGADSAPSVTTDGQTAVAVWSSTRDIDGNDSGGDNPEPVFTTDADIFMARSADGGDSWSQATAVNDNNEGDSANDTDPSVATDGDGYWMVVWSSDSGIAFARSEDNATSFDPVESLPGSAGGANAQIASDRNRSFADDEPFEGFVNSDAGYWLATFEMGGNVVVSRYLDTGPDFDLDVPEGEIEDEWREPVTVGEGSGPSISTDTLGSWLVGWHASDVSGPDADALASRTVNNGIEWGDPDPLDAGSDSDSGDDTSVQLDTDRENNWVAAWVSDDEKGDVGSDQDIRITRFTFLADCNTNGISDASDLANGTLTDDNGNLIPDACEGGPVDPDPGMDGSGDGGMDDPTGGDMPDDGDPVDDGSGGGGNDITGAVPCGFGMIGTFAFCLLGLGWLQRTQRVGRSVRR